MGEDIKTSEIVGVGDSLLGTPSACSVGLTGCGCAAAGEGASLVRGIVALYNAFYPALAEGFAGADLPTVAVWLKRDPAASNAVTLQEMKDGFAGETDPKEAAVKHPDSLRARAFRNDPALDLAGREMTVRKNFIHLSAPEDMDAWAQKDGDYAEGEFHAWFPDLVLASVRGRAISTGASKE